MYTVNEIMQFIRENDVKFIRLSFCDLKGNLKNVSIMPLEMERALTDGYQFDASPIFGNEVKRLSLFPIPSTLMAMPWRPTQGRVIRFFCDLRLKDGQPFKDDNRHKLKLISDSLPKNEVSIACAFYLLKTDENGQPTDTPWDSGGYMDVSPIDKGENVRREICLSLEEMKIAVHASYHGFDASLNVIEFKASGLLETADYLVAFKSAAQAIAARNGLFASYSRVPEGKFAMVNMTIEDKDFEFLAQSNPYIELGRLFK